MPTNLGERSIQNERWWLQKGDELGQTVWAIATALESDQGFRSRRARKLLSLYEGRAGDARSSGGWTASGDLREYDLNVSRAGCDTVVSEIAGRQRPVPKFQTSGADWKIKRRAKLLEKFCLAVLHQSQGNYLNAWELMEESQLDTTIWGEGPVKVFYAHGRINMERHFAHELFVDPIEARYGNPQSLFHIYLMERDQALWLFADDPSLGLSNKRRAELRSHINAAEEIDPLLYGTSPRLSKMVKIVESWHLPRPDGKMGKHAFAMVSATLHEEEWTRPKFPFVHLRWEPDRMGYHAKGLIEQGETQQREITNNAERLSERFKICSSKRTFVERGSVELEDLQENETEVIIEYQKGSQPPLETVPKPIAESELAWLKFSIENWFEIQGVSQSRATARKEPGVTAGVAIRTLNDMQTARFSLKAKGYENGYPRLAEQIIWCAREAAKHDPKFTVKYDEEIMWKDCDVPENTFDITIAPASSLPNDPAGRLQMAQELFSSGIIKVETFKQLLGMPDLEKEMNHQTSQRKYVEKILDTMLDVEEDGEFTPPDPLLLDKPAAIVQAAQAYFDAAYDGAPEKNLQLVRDYISAIDEQVAAAMPPPPMPGAPGAPPGGDPGASPSGQIPFAPGGGGPPSPAGGEPAARPPVPAPV